MMVNIEVIKSSKLTHIKVGNRRLTQRIMKIAESIEINMLEMGEPIDDSYKVKKWNKGYRVKEAIVKAAKKQIEHEDEMRKNKPVKHNTRGLYGLLKKTRKKGQAGEIYDEEYKNLIRKAFQIADITNTQVGLIENGEECKIVFTICTEKYSGWAALRYPAKINESTYEYKLDEKYSLFDKEGNLKERRKPTREEIGEASLNMRSVGV